MFTRMLTGTALLIGCASICPAQDSESVNSDRGPTTKGAAAILTKATEFNRSGKWQAAAVLTEQLLASGELSSADRREALVSAAYARCQLRDHKRARQLISEFQGLAADLPVGHWQRAEVAKLLGRLDGRIPSSDSTPKMTESGKASNDGFWKTATPSDLGLDTDAVAEHEQLCQRTGADSCLVVCKGRIVSEWYSQRYEPPIYAMSSTKSITSLLVGMLIDAGRIASLDDPVRKFVPQWTGPRKDRVTIRHLLSHTAGFARQDGTNSVGQASDKNKHVIALPLAHEPGERFIYSNEGVQLLSSILDKAAGQPVEGFARRNLFEPLGMTQSRLHIDWAGHAWTYADMATTPRDLARIGLLMLNEGRWNGKQIVSAKYIREARRPSQPYDKTCGLLWWIFEPPESPLRGFAALGYLDTNLFIFPAHELIVVRTQAPRNEFTGRPESAGYRKEALRLFARMLQRTSR